VSNAKPLLYGELAGWFHLLTAPHEYIEEATAYREAFEGALDRSSGSALLELGSGGGNNAWHLKARFQCTLTDISPEMIAISERINPECEHLVGDMRSLRLGRVFDAVLVHDAIMYMTTEDDLRRAFETAFLHTRPGGAAVIAPDYFLETFKPVAECGGNDGDDGRGIRYLEWVWDPDPNDTTCINDFAYLLREGTSVRAVHDRHVVGIFPRSTWIKHLEGAGFRVSSATRPDEPGFTSEIFVAVRPG
jgi:SAM-dependent methyltransferase